jgi:hypothetical protein
MLIAIGIILFLLWSLICVGAGYLIASIRDALQIKNAIRFGRLQVGDRRYEITEI